jgi:hypothetical protein
VSEEKGPETAPDPKPKKKRVAKVTIYNKSRSGQYITLHDGARLPPGATAKVPAALGKTLIERIPYCIKAERGDPMD